MKSIIIGSNCSGGGKTTFTIGLMKALKNRKLSVQGYKVGPDYIDPSFHREVTDNFSRNLDVHLMGEDGVQKSYLKGTCDVGIIEGVMGIYDGIGIGTKASTYDVSRILNNMPIILVLSPKGQSSTICAEIKGLIEYKNANIAGVVLNKVSEKYYTLLKCAIEKNCKVNVLGYIPKNEELSLKSRHLGLVQSVEVLDLKEKIELCGKVIEEYIDIDKILSLMMEYKNSELEEYPKISLNRKMKVAVAFDKAFNFYYRDNLELLESACDVVYFSPIKDEALPENIDFLYIGGGYPEVFKKELEDNIKMRESIKKALDNGLKCYAECGGLMYLTEKIEDCNMVGFFKGCSNMTKRLQNFGYCTVKINEKFMGDNLKINAHEFHKSYVECSEDSIYDVEKIQYDGEVKRWRCGYVKNNTLAGYAHINFLGNLEFLKQLLNM